ncbi:MAG: NADPH-dependent F420 reductase [Pseudomonadota bacterium]
MHEQSKVAVIGCGKVGRALGSWLAAQGQAVWFCSRRPESARAAAAAAGNAARASDLAEAIDACEVALLTLPFDAVLAALEPVRERLAGKVLVDVTNPITADHRQLKIGHTSSGAEQIASALPRSRVVKAFNAVFAEVYEARTPQLAQAPVSIFYAGDDAAAKVQVAALIRSLGFDAVDSGPLENARYLEPLSLLNIHLGRVLGNGTSIGFALTRGTT